jgi:hypothetical protein
MAAPSDFWYRLGYALEKARYPGTSAPLRSLASRAGGATRPASAGPGKDDRADPAEPGGEPASLLELALAAGAGGLAGRLLALWPSRGNPSLPRLVRAAAAGAGAALLSEAAAWLLRGQPRLADWREDLPERLVAGAARGLLYGGLVEPRLPGPGLARAVVYGGAEYALSPVGGLRGLLERYTPYRRLPVLSELLSESRGGEDTLGDHLTFALALAALYGRDGESSGIGDEGV